MEIIAPLLDALGAKYGWVTAVVAWVGALRLCFKPLMTFLHSVAEATPTAKDNQLLEKAEASGAYKAILFAMDWLASIKVGGAK